MLSRSSFALALLTLALSSSALAQQATPAAYVVVSIKIDNTARNSEGVDVQGDIYHAGNLSLKELVAGAYGISPDLISGIPSSLDSIRFDVEAKIIDADPDALRKLTAQQRAEMLKAVLADRFAVKSHIEVKTLPVYDLVVSRGGQKLQTTPPEKVARNSSISIHGAALTMRGVSMAKLAGTLTDIVHRKVIDKTGLTGQYDFNLTWSPDSMTRSDGSSTTDSAPDIFTAIEDQLGLKLQPSKGRVDFIVVDHAEMPTQN